jgi:DNA-binding Xre family transcriptional regulator
MNPCGSVEGYRAHHDNHTPTCQPCRDAQAAWQRAYEIRRYINGPMLIDPTGTARRIRALAALGWPLDDLGTRLGMSGRNMTRLTTQARVHRDTAAKVAALYNELSMTPGPSPRSRRLAKAKGWPPPLAFDDETIDDPNVQPNRGWGAVAEPIDEVAVLRALRSTGHAPAPGGAGRGRAPPHRRGLSATEIAARLGIAPRSVQRIRSKVAA